MVAHLCYSNVIMLFLHYGNVIILLYYCNIMLQHVTIMGLDE